MQAAPSNRQRCSALDQAQTTEFVGLAWVCQLLSGAAETSWLDKICEPTISHSADYLSRIALPATSTSGENRYSRIRRLPVLISTVTVMPGDSGTSRPLISIA